MVVLRRLREILWIVFGFGCLAVLGGRHFSADFAGGRTGGSGGDEVTAHPLMLLGEAALTLFLCLAIAGMVYNVASLVAVLSYGRSRTAGQTRNYPPVSILKPVRGVDPEAYQNFASFCRQDYPEGPR